MTDNIAKSISAYICMFSIKFDYRNQTILVIGNNFSFFFFHSHKQKKIKVTSFCIFSYFSY